MNDDSEVIRLEVDESDAIRGANAANNALDSYSQKAVSGATKASRAWSEHGEVVVRVADRTRNSVERLVSAIEKQATAYGKTGIDRLIAQRDQMIQRLGNEEKAVNRVRAAYEQMISAEKQLSGNAGGSESTGLRFTYIFRGIKDVAEGRGAFAAAELANQLTVLKGTALVIGGIAAGVGAVALGTYEFKKHLDEAYESAERVRGQVARFGDEQKLANAEAQVTNDKLQNTIAKLEHRPENGIKLAIDEAAVSALKLSQRLDKALQSFGELAKAGEPGTFAKIFTNAAGFEDVRELVGGKSGYGGMRAALFEATRNGGDPTSVLNQYRGQAQKLLSQSQGISGRYGGKGFESRIEILKALIGEIDDESKSYALEQQNNSLTGRKTALEGSAASAGRLTELEKRSREAYGAAYFGDQTAYGKYLGAASKIDLERADFLRLNPGTGGRANAAFDEQKAAAWLRFLDESGKALERFNLELDASGSEIAKDFPNFVKKRLSDSDTEMRNAGITDQHGNLNPLMFGAAYPTIPDGYVSPEEQLRGVRRTQQRFAGLYGLQAAIRGASPRAQANDVYAARQQFAGEEYAAQIRINEARLRGINLEEANVNALEEKKQRVFEAQLERDQTLLEITKRGFEQIKGVVSGLLDTLLHRPSQFGSQLLSTISNAALSPVVNGLSGAAAGFLTPMFFGGGTVGGGGGGFAPAMAGAVFGGGGSTGSAYDGGYSPIGGGSSGGGSPLGYAGMLGPGGTSGFSGPLGGFSSGGGGGIFRGRGPLSFLSGLRGSVFNSGNIYTGPWSGTNAAGIGGIGGTLAGIASSPAAIAGGGLLAQFGLTGNSRGTAGGTFLGAAGGALAGFGLGAHIGAIGGPWGAAIGAGAGLLIGLGEQIFGVEPPARQAHRLIMSIYHVDIPEKSGIIQQIMGIAQQFGSVSAAVRSAQARQLIEMYALATGGKSNLFLDSPRSASLIQQGGTLYQGPSYFNGSGYNFQSSLPSLGPSAGTIPTSSPYSGGAPLLLQISLNGQSAADAMAGQVARVASPQYVGGQSVAALRTGSSRFATMGAVLSPSTIYA